MTKWFGPALLAVTLIFGGSAAIKPAAAVPLQAAQETSKVTDISARRYYRHYHYRSVYRPRYYYARPYYYRPYPYYGYAPYYAPAPYPFGFGIGFGFGPWW